MEQLRIKAEYFGKVRLEDGLGSGILDDTVPQEALVEMYADAHLSGFVEPIPHDELVSVDESK